MKNFHTHLGDEGFAHHPRDEHFFAASREMEYFDHPEGWRIKTPSKGCRFTATSGGLVSLHTVKGSHFEPLKLVSSIHRDWKFGHP